MSGNVYSPGIRIAGMIGGIIGSVKRVALTSRRSKSPSIGRHSFSYMQTVVSPKPSFITFLVKNGYTPRR